MEFNNLESSRDLVPGHCYPRRGISWRGIFAGIVTALVIEALLNLLGLGIGLVSFTPDKDVAVGIGIGSAIWLIIVSIIALFVAGWVAAIASGRVLKTVCAMQGFITWGLASLIVFFTMTSTMGAIVGGITSLAGSGLKSAGNAVLNKKENDKATNIPSLSSLQARLKPGTSYDKMADDIKPAIEAYAAADNDQEKNDARQALSMAIAQNTDLTSQEANQKVADLEQSYNKMKDKAKEAARKTSRVMGIALIITFFSFLLGAIAAVLGGITGSRNCSAEDKGERDSNISSSHSRNRL
ncbi:MAG: hypothetical protein JSR33_06680 [Proteobacteria bacterium]|nr:hypothetical protein [Pseudomonadota bacterium]